MTEKQLLLAKAADLAKAAQYRTATFSGFLSPSEQHLLRQVKLPEQVLLTFYGGYPEAERRMACFHTGENPPPAPIRGLKIRTGDTPPSHREILGTLTGNGIHRNRIGDIITSLPEPVLLCEAAMAEYLLREIHRIGRAAVQWEEVATDRIPPPVTQSFVFTVASLRLDSITAEGFRISRTKAADAIRRGLVQKNWNTEEEPDTEVCAGDRISLRGKGKIRIQEIGGKSRKDRIFVCAEKYI